MSTPLDETAADVPVRDLTVNLSRLAAVTDLAAYQNARARQDISRVSREELEDRFLRLHEEHQLLKQHVHKQDDKIKKLGTKLMRLVKDRGRMEQLAVGGGQSVSRVRDVEMEEMMEELQEKVRSLQSENVGLKQRLLVAKQQLINSQSRRPTPYDRVQSRVNSGLKKLRDDASSPSQTRPKSTRSLEGGGRPPTGLLPRFGHSLLEDARSEIRNLENVIELQRSHLEEMEGVSEQLKEELRRKEAEYEERLLQVRQQQTSKLRSHVSSNVTMIKLQKQLADRSNSVTELEGRFLQLQESQRTLKVSHDAAMLKVDELSAQLKDERLKSLDLEKQLQTSAISRLKMEQLQERIGELEQERDLLKDNNEKLVNSAFDVSRQQKWQIQEQQLKLQIAQLETALKADLVDKNEILDKIKAERDSNEKLTEVNKKLQLQFLEQKQQLEELNDRLKFYSRENEYDVAELTEALLLIKDRKSQRSGDLGFLKEEQEGGGSSSESAIRELRAAHAETIQELEKTRNLLSVESNICKDYKAELDAVKKKMDSNRVESEQQLERQAALLDTRAAKIKKLEAQLRDIAYGTKTYVFKPDMTDEDEADEFNETLHLERGENLLELQIVSATLSPSALQALGDSEPSTFCTYSFYLFELHSTPVVTGQRPKYGFTSKYVVSMDEQFLEYLHRQSVTVELHQALGLDWRTLATGQLRLQLLLEQDGKVHGTMPLVGTCDDARSFGSVDYWLRLRVPMTETIRLFKEKVKAVGYISTALCQDAQLQTAGGGWNELSITVGRCRDLKKSRGSQQPSPYVVYKFFDFPDYPTTTVHDCCDPVLNDLKSYCVSMDTDLDQYLKSEVLLFYVFDYKEEQMDTYMGKAKVPLLSLAKDQPVTGVFELTDPSGLPAGHIEVTLKWKFTYVPPSGSIMTVKELIPTETEIKPEQDQHRVEDERKEKDVDETLQEEDKHRLHQPVSFPKVAASKAPLPKLRQRTHLKDGLTAKKVTFIDPSAAHDQVEDSGSAGVPAERRDTLSPAVKLCFNFDTKNFKIFYGSKENQFGYTVQQHEVGGRQWLLVGAPFESTGKQQTGDVFKCPLDTRSSANCTRLNLGKLSLDNVSERKDNMRLGMTLTSNPKDNSFVTCGPLWSHECGSSLYSTGICSKVSRNFKLSHTIAPALQRCETLMDIVIVLDGSNSIYPWYEVQDFLITILQKFYIGPGQTQVGVVQYGSTVVHEFGLGEYQTVDEVVEAARGIDQRGGEETRTALGINVARSEAFNRGGRPGAKKVMIVITDGESHDSPQLVQAVADSEKDNITMYAIAVLGYYNRRGINPEAFLKEIKFIASDPDEKHFFNVSDESALKDIVDALGERIFSLEGTSSQGRGFGLQMAQAGFSSHLVKDGILLGAVGAYDWNGAVLKETKHGKVVPPKFSYKDEFPDELKNHGAYLGYSVGSLISSRGSQLYVSGAPRFNHTGKVIVFTLKNTGNLTILQALLGEQIGSYFGSELLSMDVDSDGQTDILLVAAPMFCSQGWERGKVYIYTVTPQTSLILQGALEVSDRSQNSRLGSAMAQIPDMNGDGFRELVVGAPLEDDHQGAVYVYYGQDKTIQRQYRQRLSAAGFSAGLKYFGQSLHGILDVNADGLVDLTVGALGAAVIVWSRGVVRIQAKLTFEPEKVNIFNKDCLRGGKEVTCMSVIVCLSLESRTKSKTKSRTDVAVWYSLVLDERRFPPRAVLDESGRQQPRSLSLQVGGQSCQRLGFSIQETTDYGRPIAVVLETGLKSLDEGPVLDPDWPSVLRAELPFWNGCEQEDTCVPDLILYSHTDLLDVQQFCSSRERAVWSICSHHGASEGSVYVMEAGRRRMVVFARLENQGENAYGAAIHISTSSNLLFSSLIVKDQSDIQIECYAEDRLASQRNCNISAPFMKSLAQVSFRLEFEFSRTVFLDHVRVVMTTSSEGEEGYPDDNINDIFLPLKYQTDLLFTRDPNPPRFEIRTDSSSSSSSSSSWDHTDSSSPNFNLTYHIQNLGMFSVQDVLFRADVWAVTRQGNQLVNITEYSIEQVAGSDCVLPQPRSTNQVTAEDLSHLSQLNHSNSVSVTVQCRLNLPASRELKVTLSGQLQIPALLTVNFRSLELLTEASIQLEASSHMFLQEERPVREIILELRKDEDYTVPVWIILGSSLGGLLLLALLVLALWKLGFFNRRRRQEEEEQPVANGKAAEEL